MGARVTLYCLSSSPGLREAEGGSEPLVPLGKQLAVLAYLALAPGRAGSRETLADLLWGDRDRSTARQALRRVVHQMRARVGPWVVGGDDNVLTLSECVTVDLHEFTLAAADGRTDDALAWYEADFLTGFASPGAHQFEAWATIERAHLRARALHLAEMACRSALDAGCVSRARALAVRARQIDPNSEPAQRLGLTAALSSGDAAAIAAETARLTAWLDADRRDAEPSTRDLLRRATQRPRHRDATQREPLVGEMVGREREFAALLNLWRATTEGAPQLVTITGGAGLGKSRLLRAVADRLDARRNRSVLVRAFPGEKGLAFSFAAEVAIALSSLDGAAGVDPRCVDDLVVLDPRIGGAFGRSSSPAPATPVASRLAVALRELVRNVAEEGPLALLLDDVHWIDEESRSVLRGAVERLPTARIMVIATSRGASLWEGGSGAEEIPLRPFGETEVAALLETIALLAPESPWRDRLVHRLAGASRGVPLLLLDSIEQLTRAGVLIVSDGRWAAPNAPRLDTELAGLDSLSARLRALPSFPQRVLQLVSLAGAPVPLAVLERAAGPSELGPALQALELDGYVRQTSRGLEAGHDSIAEACLGLIAAGQLRDARVSLGRAMLEEGDEASRRRGLVHLTAAHSVPDCVAALRRATGQPAFRNRTARTIAKTLLDPTADDEFLDRVCGQLTFFDIVRPFARRLIATATVALLLVLPFIALRLHAGPANTLLLVPSDPGAKVDAVPLERASWDLTRSLVPSLSDDRPAALARAGRAVRPATGELAVEGDSPDSGGVDVYLVSRDGTRERLTRSPADETPEAWAPDGQSLIIATSAYNAVRFKTLAILDLRTRALRPFGPRTAPTQEAAWSPDGSRIAYLASPEGADSIQFCVSSVDELHQDCRSRLPRGTSLLGWTSPTSVLVRRGREIDRWSSEQRMWTRVLAVENVSADLSPGGKWLVARTVDGAMLVTPADDPMDSRHVLLPKAVTDFAMQWRTANHPEYIDSVRVSVPATPVPLGVPTRLLADGVSNRGNEVQATALQWRSLTPGVAAIDSTGTLVGLSTGVAKIEASVGGWRRAVITVAIGPARIRSILAEHWTNRPESRWTYFGAPRPIVVNDSQLGPALLPNGDGSYFSGAYLTRLLDPKAGLAVDADLRIRITGERHQYIEVSLYSWPYPLDSLARWDSRTGYLPAPPRGAAGAACSFAYPSREGPGGVRSAVPIGALFVARGALRPLLADGTVRHLRVQVFPDGRCGVALEGEPPAVGVLRLPPGPLILAIQGSTVGTQLLVGGLSVTEGVPSGTNWVNARPLH